ncbi:MAG: 16S rRNA (guanine(527)-N(7))-methyltransferase RsmG [Eubacteriales bacterium]|nr:16S rRNA (guanine(527)-N(7))-methyltransferase RsmG [Eubacteriales bacterium]
MGEVLGREVPGAEAVTERVWSAQMQARIEGLGICCDGRTPGRIARYHTLLCGWNARMNLTGDTDFAVAADRLYADSLAPLRLEGLFPQGASLIDVGSGAGFPGLPLAIARPDLQVTLLDALGKRVNFLAAVVEDLGLENVRLVHARAEDGGRDPAHRERYDVAVARAVAPLPVLCELLLPFVRVGGHMGCYKGPAAGAELEAGARAAKLLGGGAISALPVDIPSQPEWRHCVLLCQKEQKTVRQYPRKAGTPGREPLGGFVK